MNVLVTRPDSRGQELVELLNQQQIFAIHQPLFQIEAGNDLPQLPSILNRLNRNDFVFAVSKYAVDFAHNTLEKTGFQFRDDLRYFAVGKNTARHFSEQVELAVIYPLAQETSEGVLALPEFQDLTDKNIVILRADRGRELLANEAQKRGASVQYVACYRRVPVQENVAEQISLCKRVGVDTIVITSGEILLAMMEQAFDEDKAWLMECRLVVVSRRIAHIARNLGWQDSQIQLAPKADNQTLLNTLLQFN